MNDSNLSCWHFGDRIKTWNFNVFETADSGKSKLILVERFLFAEDKKERKISSAKTLRLSRKARGNAEVWASWLNIQNETCEGGKIPPKNLKSFLINFVR